MSESTYDNCISIIEDKKKLNYAELESKWNVFKEKYPKLYDMLTMNENIDLKMLKFLCDNAQKQKQLSEDEQFETEVKIGDVLAKKYIYNKFPEPSNEQKEIIKQKIRDKFKNKEKE